MRSSAFIWTTSLTLLVLLTSVNVAAEPPPTPAAAEVREDMTSDLVRSASKRVIKRFQMTVFEDEETGSEAFFSLEPDFHPGCKVKLTLRF
jgi:hypothetical protein